MYILGVYTDIYILFGMSQWGLRQHCSECSSPGGKILFGSIQLVWSYKANPRSSRDDVDVECSIDRTLGPGSGCPSSPLRLRLSA